MSEWYHGKIVPTELALAALGVELPETLEYDGKRYTKTENGYVLEGMEQNRDVCRGLYRLCIPSNFIFKCDFANYCHVVQQRGEQGTANPEVKLCCEEQVRQIEQFQPMLSRDLMMRVKS